MKISIPLIFAFVSLTCDHSFAGSWALTTPYFEIRGSEIMPTKKWAILESFATVLQCNDHRSTLIKKIDSERRSLREAEDRATIETEQDIKLLWHLYTHSKCVFH